MSLARTVLEHLRRAALAYAVLLVALVLTFLAYYYVRQTVADAERVLLKETAQQVQDDVARRMVSYTDALLGARGLFYASNSVEADEWAGYARGIGLEERYGGMRILGYSKRIEPAQRSAFDAELSRTYKEEGSLVPTLRPGGERSDYFPMTYVEPLDEANKKLLGYDPYSNPVHRPIMDLARDTGQPQSTRKVYLLSEAPSEDKADFALNPGFVVYVPIYRKGEPTDTVEERRNTLDGFIVGAVEAEGLLREIFRAQSGGPSIDFEVYDGEGLTQDHLLYDSDGVRRASGSQKPSSSGFIDKIDEVLGLPVSGEDTAPKNWRFDSLDVVEQREWQLYSEALPGFEYGRENRLPLFVLLSGLAVSLLLFSITFLLVRSRSRTERARQDLENTNRELEATNRELETFSYSVSHDLRAPLRSIDGFSQILLEDYADELDEDGKDYLGRVRGASQRMGRLIDDILGLSRVTRGTMVRERVNLSSLAEEVAGNCREERPERTVKFSAQKGLEEWGDPRLLRVALVNLIGNAWKFTEKESEARIEFGVDEKLSRKGRIPVYYVRDNGAGFEMAYADKLFGTFQRLHAADEFEGTGIGLATVQRIVHRHGGRVWAEGEVGRGATFFFTLRPGLRFDPAVSRAAERDAQREEEVKAK